jgi:hypothetical protein
MYKVSQRATLRKTRKINKLRIFLNRKGSIASKPKL